MTARQKIDQEYATLSPEEIAELKGRAEKEQHAKTFVAKPVKYAQQNDIAKVAKSFQQAVSAKTYALYYMVVLMYSSLMPSIPALGTMAFASLSVVTTH